MAGNELGYYEKEGRWPRRSEAPSQAAVELELGSGWRAAPPELHVDTARVSSRGGCRTTGGAELG